MTVTFVDPPGETLPSRQEPIDFSATREVTSVRVAYDEEEVYDGSVFKAPYLSSTKVGNAFSIVRTGSWKKPFTIHVNELSPADAAWTAIYSADLETVPNTSMTAAGSYSLLDATWWAKGALWSSGTADAVNGSGIRLAGADFTPGNTWRSSNSGLRLNFLPFSQFDDWNAALPTWVALRFSGPMLGSQNRYPVAGLLGAAADANGLTASEYAQAASIQFYTQVLDSNTNWIGVGSSFQEVLVSVPGSAALSDYDDFQFGLMRGMQGAYSPGASLWTGSTTAPGTSAQHITGQLTGLKAQELANLGFFFTLHGPLNGLATSAILNKLTIYQPRAA